MYFSAQLEWLDDIKNRNLAYLSSKNVIGLLQLKQENNIIGSPASFGKSWTI